MQRRDLLVGSAASSVMAANGLWPPATSDAPVFTTKNAAWQKCYAAALRVLAGKVQVMPPPPHPYVRFDGPVLIEGAETSSATTPTARKPCRPCAIARHGSSLQQALVGNERVKLRA